MKKRWTRKRGRRRRKKEGQRHSGRPPVPLARRPETPSPGLKCAPSSWRHLVRGQCRLWRTGRSSPVYYRPHGVRRQTDARNAGSKRKLVSDANSAGALASSHHLEEGGLRHRRTVLTSKETALLRRPATVTGADFQELGFHRNAAASVHGSQCRRCLHRRYSCNLTSLPSKPQSKIARPGPNKHKHIISKTLACISQQPHCCDNKPFTDKHSHSPGYSLLPYLLSTLLLRPVLEESRQPTLESKTITADGHNRSGVSLQLGQCTGEKRSPALKVGSTHVNFKYLFREYYSCNIVTKAGTGTLAAAKRSRRPRCERLLNRWLICVALVLFGSSASTPTLASVSQAAAEPSSPFSPFPSYVSSSSQSSSSLSPQAHTAPWPARYRLIPPSQTNESIFIYFNPPSIDNLRVNTRRKVSFSFKVRRQGPGIPSPLSSSAQSTTSISSLSTAPSSKGGAQNKDSNSSRGGSRGHVEVAFSDAAADPGSSTNLLTTTGATASATNTVASNINPVNQSPVTDSGLKSTWSNKSRPNEGRKPQHQQKPAVFPSQLHSSSQLLRAAGPRALAQREKYRVMIYSDNDIIARPLVSSKAEPAIVRADSRGSYILMDVTAGRTHNFSVEAHHIGRVTMSVAVIDVDGDKAMNMARYVQAVTAYQYQVSAVRGERTADLVFNIAAAAIAIIITFGIGAVTELDKVKRQLKYPVALIVGFCCQFILMPVMAFGLAMLLPLVKDIRFGLLCVACVPGGGLGHVAVVIAEGDVPLSLTLNLISAIAMLGTAPLWIFVLGQYFQGDSETVLISHSVPVYYFEIWLAASSLAYGAGLLIKRFRPHVADAILMWLIKPFLLLASILYITLGVYINMYVFEFVNEYALLGAMLLPLVGCVVGAVAGAAFRQPYAFVKTIALETSSLNCLLLMVALRFSLKQPDADLAATIPIWVMFTIPGLYATLAICNKIKNIIRHYWDNRNGNKKESGDTNHGGSKAYSVSSSVVSPPGTTTLSAPLVVADGGLDDDLTISTMSNQKVTVL